MARRKLNERHIRSLTKVSGGTSYAITLPKEYIYKLKWRAKQKVDVKLYGDRIIIRDWKPGFVLIDILKIKEVEYFSFAILRNTKYEIENHYKRPGKW